MKLNIQITQHKKGIFATEEKIVDIDINNGNWKYWDCLCEGTEKTSLTINNINDANYLHLPVKDAYGYFNHKLWKEERKLELEGASVRTYDTLLSYLNYRINNAKEDYKKWGDAEKSYTAVLFEERFKKTAEDTVVEDIVYEEQGMITVKVTIL